MVTKTRLEKEQALQRVVKEVLGLSDDVLCGLDLASIKTIIDFVSIDDATLQSIESIDDQGQAIPLPVDAKTLLTEFVF